MQDEEASPKQSLDLESALAQQSTSPSLEAVHSDPGSRPKIKSRSRFSTAIRKLSGSTRKKDQAGPEVSQDTVISSGGEEPDSAATTSADSKLKKKSRLSKRFLLSSLSKKSKISPKTSIDADDDNEERTAALDAFLDAERSKDEEGSSTKDTKSKVASIAACGSTQKQSKVQITISGKKSDEISKSDTKGGKTKASSSEADYLKSSEETTKDKQAKETYSEPTLKAFSSAEAATKAKKKLKTKTTSKPATVSGATIKKTKPKETTEKLVVTHSKCDTPPSERAPLKPTRSVSGSSTNTTNETPTAVRKTTTRAAATTTSPSLTQRLIGSTTKSKQQRANTLPASEAESTPESQTAPQRGFRFTRPTTTTFTSTSLINQPLSTTITTIPKLTTTTSVDSSTASALKQRQLQFQQKSESQSKPSTTQSLLKQSADLSSASPTSQPPINPIPDSEIESTTRSTKRQQSGLTTRNFEETLKPANSSGQDDIVSSAESAAYQAGYETRPISQDLSDEAAETALRLAARSIRKQATVSSNLSSSSESQSSVNHHTKYILEPKMSEFNSREESKDDFDLRTEATENLYHKDKELFENQMPSSSDLAMDAEMEPMIMTSTNTKNREHLYKILVIGEAGTGKTSFIKRYVHKFFSQNYRATIGVDFALKVLQWDDKTLVRLQLWDIAGQERFGNMTRVYYKEAVGAFIVFDVTRNGTFDCVSKWKEDLDSKVQLPNGNPIPCILLANKCDQERQGIATQPKKIDDYVQENGFAGWFETSAKDNINIEEAARALVSKILLNDKLITDCDLTDSQKLNLNKLANADGKSKCSC